LIAEKDFSVSSSIIDDFSAQPVIRLYSVPLSTFAGEDEEGAGEGSPEED